MRGSVIKTRLVFLTTCIVFSVTGGAIDDVPAAIASSPPYCPPTKRYDVNVFPPRCFDCPRVISNQMQVARIATTLRVQQRSVQKFSPGLPQNQTCGCWRSSSNQTFEIALNSSWIVTGLAFGSERTRWLKEFDVHASDDNRTFIPWGAFNMSNFTTASLALFSYPIRAKFFRITVHKYNNHYVNSSTGFFLKPVQALVSRDHPFTCGCPMVSSGACCPFINMTVRNDTCVWCMDPGDIMTRMVDGCGKCKKGAFEHAGRCYRTVKRAPINSLSVGSPNSDGLEWRVNVNFTTDALSLVTMFVARGGGGAGLMHPCAAKTSSELISTCCLKSIGRDNSSIAMMSNSAMYTPILWNFTPPDENYGLDYTSNNSDCTIEGPAADPPSSIKQFVQFDRGRQPYSYTLSFTEQEIRAWASCNNATGICIGTIGALFITKVTRPPTAFFLPQFIQQQLQYNLNVPSMVCTTSRTLPKQARAEMHYYVAADTYTVRVLGMELRGDVISYQWVSADAAVTEWNEIPNSLELIILNLPSNDPTFNVSSLRIKDATTTTLRIDPPITPVVHGSLMRSTHAGISVDIQYGFGFNTLPSFGDTDQIVIVTAKSTQPTRLKRLVTVTNPGGLTVAYTTSKGFISDTKRVLDLGAACYQDNSILSRWLLQAIQLLDTEGLAYSQFVERSCHMVISGEVAKAYWLVPYRGSIADRIALAGVDVIAEFA